MTPPLRVAIAIGSNLGNRYALLRSAVRAISAIRSVALLVESQIEEIAAFGPPQPPYLNQMVLVECRLSLSSLLTELQAVEAMHGRLRSIPKGPRTLDLDIVYAGDVSLSSDSLLVPHPGLVDRAFWQRELAELVGVEAAANAIAAARAHAGRDTAGGDTSGHARRWSGSWETVV